MKYYHNFGKKDDHKGGILVFNDMLDSNQKAIDPCYMRRRHKDLDVYYLSQFVWT